MSVHPAPTRLTAFMQRRPLVSYFGMAYLFAWLTWIPLVLGQTGLGILPVNVPLAPAVVIGSFTGPTLAAFILAGTIGGPPALLDLLRRYVRWRVGWRWYGFALYGVLGIEIAASTLSIGPDFVPHMLERPLAVLLFPLVVLANIDGGPLGEEAGWRGFALPRLQQHWGPLRGTLVLGTLWALWHLPIFFVPVLAWPQTRGVVPFWLVVTSSAIIITWVYNKTGGSLLLTIITHSALNAGTLVIDQFVPLTSTPSYYLAECIGVTLVALVILIITGGRLGYSASAVPARAAEIRATEHF